MMSDSSKGSVKVEMTAKERVLTTLKFGVTDRVPCLPYLRDMAIKYAGYRFSEVLDDIDKFVYSQVRGLDDFGTDAVWDFGIAHFIGELIGGKILYFEDDQPASEPPEVEYKELAEKLTKLDFTKSPGMMLDLQLVRMLRKAVGPDCPVVGYAVMPFRFAAEARGMQQIMLDLILEPDVVRQIQEMYIPLGISFAEALADAGADVIWLTNPLASSSCISRKHYEEMIHPYSQQFLQELKKRNIKSIYHICGDWRDRLDLVTGEGTDCLYIDRGDIAEFKKAIGPEVALMGNVDVVGVLLEGSPALVTSETNKCLTAGVHGGGFILSGSCGVPRDVPAQNIRAMAKTCHRFVPNF